MKDHVHRFRVFTDQDGAYGDEATVVVDEGQKLSVTERQALARELGTGETVFINDASTTDISIVHYDSELDFAGVAAVAAASFLAQLSGTSVAEMHSKGGAITTWQKGDITWVRASLSAMPDWHFEQLPNVAAVEALDDQKAEHTMFWAWADETKGLVRARTFAPDLGYSRGRRQWLRSHAVGGPTWA